MPEHLYFSEREEGLPQADRTEISVEFWGGFVALVGQLLADGSLAEKFPELGCLDFPSAITGCNWQGVGNLFRGENPSIPWPLQPDNLPSTLAALDAVEFFRRYVSEPRLRNPHSHFAHEHLRDFDPYSAQGRYHDTVNRLFRRNRHPYEIRGDGEVHRVGPPVLQEILSGAVFQTGDPDLDGMLNSARGKFGSPDPAIRKEALEKLWDAWERLKTLEDPDKKAGVDQLLTKAVCEPILRQRVDADALALTKIGNDFMIRHKEHDKIPIARDEHVDYLFHRLFALIWLLLKSTGRLR